MKRAIPCADAQADLFFDGSTFDPDTDSERLGKQLARVRELTTKGLGADLWWTLDQLQNATGFPQASISARLRDLRKPRFGEHTVERRRCAEGAGTWEYRVTKGG